MSFRTVVRVCAVAVQLVRRNTASCLLAEPTVPVERQRHGEDDHRTGDDSDHPR